MADLFQLSLNDKVFGVEVPTGTLDDIIETFSHINDYNSWKASIAKAFFTTVGQEEVEVNGQTVTRDVDVVDTVALDAYATKARFFAVQLRDFVVEKYGNFKKAQALSQANSQVDSVITSFKESVVTKE